MNRKIFAAALLLGLFTATASISEAVTMAAWQNVTFFGSSRNDVLKALGKPDSVEAKDEMDSYLISDSPDLMMMGILRYQKSKVVSVFVVCQPKVPFLEAREMQMKNDELEFTSENSQGILFKHRKPVAGGPLYMSISPSDDDSTGPMLCESIDNPFEDNAGAESSQPAAAPQKAATAKKDLDTSVMNKDIFDWQMIDDAGKLKIINDCKKLWRATGAETDKNDMPAKTILEKIALHDQANIFECACKAAGINPEQFYSLRDDD